MIDILIIVSMVLSLLGLIALLMFPLLWAFLMVITGTSSGMFNSASN